MIKVTTNRKEAEALFGRLESGVKGLDPIKQSARYLRAQVAESFDAQRDPYGNKWAPLKDSTLALRKRAGIQSTRILFMTGAMRRSLRVRDDTVEIRTPAEYHQEGAETRMFGKNPVQLPQRKILPINDAGEAALPETWMEHIVDIFVSYIRGL